MFFWGVNSVHLHLRWLLIYENFLRFYLLFSDCSLYPLFLFRCVSVSYFSLVVFYVFPHFLFFLFCIFLFCGYHEVSIKCVLDKSLISSDSILSLLTYTSSILFLLSFYVFVVAFYSFVYVYYQIEVTIDILKVFPLNFYVIINCFNTLFWNRVAIFYLCVSPYSKFCVFCVNQIEVLLSTFFVMQVCGGKFPQLLCVWESLSFFISER